MTHATDNTTTFQGVTVMHLMYEELARAQLRDQVEHPLGHGEALGAERLRLVAARRRQRRSAALRRLRLALGR
jgi:hypothetical protein